MSFGLTYSNQEITLFQQSGGRSVRMALPEGLVRVGRINDPARFAEIIKQAMVAAKPAAIQDTDVIIGLPEEQAFIKLLEMPAKLSPTDLRAAVVYQWQGLLPVTSDQVYFDCCYLKDRPDKNNDPHTARVLIVAYPKDIINVLLISLNKAGLKPDLFIPLSFGLAGLFSQPDASASMILNSDTGQDVSVTLIQNGVTQFSTTIHATVDDPKLVKQLESIKLFYEKNIGTHTTKVSGITVLPTIYSQNLANQLTQFSIPIAPINLGDIFSKATNPPEMIPFLALAGLQKRRPSVSILPPELGENRKLKKQTTVYRTILVSMTTTLVIVIYLSLVFLLSLQFNSRTRVHYSQPLTDRITSESVALSKEIDGINALINKIAPLADKRSHTNTLVSHANETAKQSSVTLTKISLDETKSFSIEGTTTNQSAIGAYIESLKTHAAINQIKQEIPQSLTPSDILTFRLTITLK